MSPSEIWLHYLNWTQREVNTGKPDGHCSQLCQWQLENDLYKQAEMINILYMSICLIFLIWDAMYCKPWVWNMCLTMLSSYFSQSLEYMDYYFSELNQKWIRVFLSFLYHNFGVFGEHQLSKSSFLQIFNFMFILITIFLHHVCCRSVIIVPHYNYYSY